MSKIKKIQLNEHGSSMGSRELGESIRVKTLFLIKEGFDVLFDFSGVSIISSAFSDELFGKLFIELGEDVFKDRIKINRFDDKDSKNIILLLINKAIAYRKKNNYHTKNS